MQIFVRPIFHCSKNRFLTLNRVCFCKFSNVTNSSQNATLTRNIGIIAHIDGGKTTTTERMLFYSGFTDTIGNVDEGDTVTDYLEQERERGITITSASITFPWRKHKINLIDTPGHVDFTIEVERALSVLDGAVTILDGSAGVEAQTYTVWRQAERYRIPRIFYLNKMDKPISNVYDCLKSIIKKLNVKPLLLQLPIGEGKRFSGVVDLISMEKQIWNKNLDTDGQIIETTSLTSSENSLYEKASQLREDLVSGLADIDEGFGEIVLNCDNLRDLSEQDINKALRRITIKQKAFPVLCGSSYHNIGVQPLLNAIVKYLPSPVEKPRELLKYYRSNLCAFAFKIIHSKQLGGALTFLRVYSGELKKGQTIYNINRQCQEKVNHIFVAFADEFKEVLSVSSGDIAVVTGLTLTTTGDTLILSSLLEEEVKSTIAKERNILIEDVQPLFAGIDVPEPVFFCSIEAPSLSKQNQLETALEKLQKEDPTLKVIVDNETGQTVVKGMGELHLEIIKDRILKEYGLDAYMGPLQISYREAIQRFVEETLVFDKVYAGHKNFVKLTLRVARSDKLENSFKLVTTQENELGRLRADHLKSLKKGIESATERGPLLACPVRYLAIEVLWCEIRRGTSHAMISGATAQCLLSALKKASPVLIEPIMLLEITTPETYAERIISDLANRRGNINNMESRGDIRIISAFCPLAALISYSRYLRTLTSGLSSFSMTFHSYSEMSETESKRTVQHVTGFSIV